MGRVWVTCKVTVWRKILGTVGFWRADAESFWLGRCAMAWLVGTPRERAGRAERGRRPTAGLRVQNADAESKHISLSLSLLLFKQLFASLADVSPLAVH